MTKRTNSHATRNEKNAAISEPDDDSADVKSER